MKKTMTIEEVLKRSGLELVKEYDGWQWEIEAADGRHYFIWEVQNFTNFSSYYGVEEIMAGGKRKTLATRCLFRTAIAKVKNN